MKLMERYGSPIIAYDGACHSTIKYDNETYRIKGYFEAAQFSFGRFEVGILVNERVSPNKIEFGLPLEASSIAKLTFDGCDRDGWR